MMSRATLSRTALAALIGTLAACAQTPPPAGPTPGDTAMAAAAPAKQPPPEALPLKPVSFPQFTERTLPNGMRLIVLEKHDLPVANVNLYIQSGESADPVEKIGLAEMTADLLTKGTRTRSAQQIAETIEGVGGNLSATSGLDYTTVSATALTDQLPLLFDLVSDVALRPTFPQDELEAQRKRTLTGLQLELGQPGAIAQRRFLQEIYGPGNPYGFSSIPATVEAITRADLVRFHDRNFKADNALLVVSGDVTPAQVEALASNAFGAWQGGFGSDIQVPEPPASGPARVTLVHRPGSVQSNILVGNVGITPDNPDYFPLQVMNKIVGGGTDARLFLILREEKGWTYGAYSQLSRPKEVGYYAASAEVRTEVTDSALVELMNQLRRIRDEPVSAEELANAKSYLIGSFPLRIQPAGQIAGQVAQTELLGLPIEDLTEYRERIDAVTIEDVQRVARQYVRPDQAEIVVVGDAARIADGLKQVAPVAIFDVEGNPVEAGALQVQAASETFSAAALKPMELTYQVLVQGNPFGTATNKLAQADGGWVGTASLQLGPVSQQREVRFTSDLTPISSTATISQGPQQMSADLTFESGTVSGTAKLPEEMGGDKTFSENVPQGTIFAGMDEYAIAVADLAPGKTITIPVFNFQSGSVANATFNVAAAESVTVPAGTYQAYKIAFSQGEQSGTLWVRQEAPHITVKQELATQPVAIVLESMQ
ncbi:hypothetical protein BH23GEM4_BH23GEM4_16480 [soil metagenome]